MVGGANATCVFVAIAVLVCCTVTVQAIVSPDIRVADAQSFGVEQDVFDASCGAVSGLVGCELHVAVPTETGGARMVVGGTVGGGDVFQLLEVGPSSPVEVTRAEIITNSVQPNELVTAIVVDLGLQVFENDDVDTALNNISDIKCQRLANTDMCAFAGLASDGVGPSQRASFAVWRNDTGIWRAAGTTLTALRLPAQVTPRDYEVSLELFTATDSLESDIVLDINVGQSGGLTRVVLNGVGLILQSVECNGTTIPLSQITSWGRLERLVIMLPTPQFGQAKVVISYTASISTDALTGLYSSTDPNGGVVVGTHFEPTDARRVFPCFDEPALKARWSVCVSVEEQVPVILSNMPRTLSTVENGRRRGCFERSVPMSSYLLAIVAGDFIVATNNSVMAPRELSVAVWVPAGRSAEEAHIAARSAEATVTRMSAILQSPFPLPKLDLIAIPDYPSGATEHWGLVTFRDSTLLTKPEDSSATSQQRVASVVAHEVAHSWFGNYVTCSWWDDLWLNEGFASLWEYVGVHAAFPSWRIWDSFFISDLARAEAMDALPSSHPLVLPKVVTSADMHGAFDSITYSKGASVLRMLAVEMAGGRVDVSSAVTSGPFVTALRLYLQRFAFASATTQDLLQVLDEVQAGTSHRMSNWLFQAGIPLVKVLSISNLEARLSQSRLLPESTPIPEGAQDSTWYVPVYVYSDSSIVYVGGLDAQEGSIPFGPWSLLGAFRSAVPCRVMYPQKHMDRLEEQPLPASSAARIVDDAFNLATLGVEPLGEYALRLAARYLALDTSYDSRIFTRALALVASKVGAARPALQQVVSAAAESALTSLQQWKVTSHTRRVAAASIVSLALHVKESQTVDMLTKLFDNRLTGDIAPDIISEVLAAGVLSGSRATFDTLLAEYQQGIGGGVGRGERLRALGLAEPSLILPLALNASVIRLQDTVSLLSYVGANGHTAKVWDFIKDNWEQLSARYAGSNFAMRSLVGIAGGFDSVSAHDAVKQFFVDCCGCSSTACTGHAAPPVNAVTSMLDEILLNSKWLSRNEETVTRWVSAVNPDGVEAAVGSISGTSLFLSLLALMTVFAMVTIMLKTLHR